MNLSLLRLSFLIGGLALASPVMASHEHAEEKIVSLEAAYTVRRDGKLNVKQTFQVQVEGHEIRKGPCLSYLTVYQGPGGLVLDNRMSVKSVTRNGNPEPFHVVHHDGMKNVFVGSKDTELKHGIHRYVVEYVSAGDWKAQDGEMFVSFNLLEAFRNLPVDAASARFSFPEGTEIRKASISLEGTDGKDCGYEFGQTGGGFEVSTTGKLKRDHSLFLNLVLAGDGFSLGSPWLAVMQQHPRLPISAFTGFALCWAMGLILYRAFRRRRVSDVAA